MRTIQDAKLMARSLRDDLAAKNLALSHSECLELVARQFGLADWNTLSSKLDASERPADSATLAPAVQIIKMNDEYDRYALVPQRTDESVDVVFMIHLYRDKQLIAMPCLAGTFGRDSYLEIQNLLRVSCVTEKPEDDGNSLTKVIVAVFTENGWRSEQMSGRLPLSMTPSFQIGVEETPFRVDIRPRRLIRGAPGALAVSATIDVKAQMRAREAKDAATPAAAEMLRRPFSVSIHEIRQSFAQGDNFTGVYKKTVMLSDGTECEIELTPSILDGEEWMKAQFPGNNDPKYYNYIGLYGGTAIRNNLMVQVWDVRKLRELLRS